jgi:hypothetical protein
MMRGLGRWHFLDNTSMDRRLRFDVAIKTVDYLAPELKTLTLELQTSNLEP